MTDQKQSWPFDRKPDLPTTEIMGMDLPIIANLDDGWFLVAHPNGAVIARKTFLSVLWTESSETGLTPGEWADDENADTSPIPEAVRAKAVEEFERLVWPLVRGQWYTEAKSEVPVHTASPPTQ